MQKILPFRLGWRNGSFFSPQAMIYILLALMLAVASIISPGYLQITHLAGILRLASFLGIAAIGQNLAILSGGIDLSIAQMICMGNIFGAQIMMARNDQMLPALLVVVALGAAFGALNGLGIKYLKIPAFIMTLATSCIVQGVCLIYTKGAPKGNTSPLLKAICNERIFNIMPPIVVLWLVLAVITIVILKCTPFGRRIYAVGANETAARFSGVNTEGIVFAVYIISAVFAALAGYLLVGYTGTSYLDAGVSYHTKSVAAVVIGGTSVQGGRGNYLGTIAGAISFVVLEDFLVILNMPEAGRNIALGVLIIALVLFYKKDGHTR